MRILYYDIGNVSYKVKVKLVDKKCNVVRIKAYEQEKYLGARPLIIPFECSYAEIGELIKAGLLAIIKEYEGKQRLASFLNGPDIDN